MHEESAFITLTYSEENLESPRLIYSHFQNFMKRLRKTRENPIGVFVTGEYGEKTKRPHWHAIIFGWKPRENYKVEEHESGNYYYSKELEKLWPFGRCNYGVVNEKTAGYCARYAAKKLVHGKDDKHDFHPISKKSSKHAIGKKWLEKFWKDVFNQGYCVLTDGTKAAIPRYYEKWLKENRPVDWLSYVTRIKLERALKQSENSKNESAEWWRIYHARDRRASTPLTRNQVRKLIKEKRFNELQAYLKL